MSKTESSAPSGTLTSSTKNMNANKLKNQSYVQLIKNEDLHLKKSYEITPPSVSSKGTPFIKIRNKESKDNL